MGGNSSLPKYDRNVDPGVAFIFNHIKFDERRLGNRMFTPKERIGSLVDEKRIIEVFKDIGIPEPVIYRDLTDREVKDTMNYLKDTDFSKVGYMVIVIMTHGGRYNALTSKDGYYFYDDDILFNLYQNKTLKNVIKIIFIQGCRGGNSLAVDCNDPDPLELDDEPAPKKMNSPLTVEHYITLFSSTEGFPSWRDEQLGSLFIQSVCDNLQKYAETKDILFICDEISKDVKENSKEKIQLPELRKNLVKKFVFGDFKKIKPLTEEEMELRYNIATAQIESFVE